jgi:hypothetical protein
MDCHRHPDNRIVFRHSRSVCNRPRSFHASRCRRCETRFPGGCRRRKGASFRSHRNREHRQHDFAGIEGSRLAERKAARASSFLCLEKPWQNSRDDPGAESRRRRCVRSSGKSKYQAVSQLPVDILGAGEKTPPIQVIDLPRLTSNDITSIEELFNNLWFYGVVVYDDIFGWRRTLEFVLQYSGVLHGLSVFKYRESEVRRPDPKAKARRRFGERTSKKSRPSPE